MAQELTGTALSSDLLWFLVDGKYISFKPWGTLTFYLRFHQSRKEIVLCKTEWQEKWLVEPVVVSSLCGFDTFYQRADDSISVVKVYSKLFEIVKVDDCASLTTAILTVCKPIL